MGLVIDNFAGGGGASTGIETALGRQVDVAINHDPEAVAMHAINHPGTRHYCQSVWRADPLEVTGGKPVDLAWFSPDCKHFSKAKGGKPVEKNIRDLAWIVVLWAQRVKPAIIMLENVEEFRTWGPLLEDGKPCPDRRGMEFLRWLKELKKAGYKVEWKELRACDYGAPTSRKRLFLIARRDGLPIVWPKPTHGPGLIPYRTAADIIDWSIPCPSIFTRARPLKDATCRRIAAGIMRFVVNAAQPFIVPVTNTGWNPTRSWDADEPLRTITTAKGGEMALVAPAIVGTDFTNTRAARSFPVADPLRTITSQPGHAMVAAFLSKFSQNSVGTSIDEPVHTVMAGAPRHGLVLGHVEQANGGPRNRNLAGRAADAPLSTITARGTQQRLVTSHVVKLKGTCRDGHGVDEPIHTVQAGGLHYGEVRAFLTKYYGTDQNGQQLDGPLHTISTRDRFGLVTVNIGGEPYAITDIGMRMLTPRELFRAQGFPESYIIDFNYNGRPLTKTSQVRMCGNSVCPPMAEALVRANVPGAIGYEAARAAA